MQEHIDNKLPTAANIVTCCRIPLSAVLLFCSVFSAEFYIVYALAGISDILDGIIARKTRTESSIGSKLDTIADMCFVLCCLIKIFPYIFMPLWLWIWVIGIAVIKMGNVIFGFVVQKRFVAVHSVANKVIGVLMFLLMFILPAVNVRLVVTLLAFGASFAAFRETHYILQHIHDTVDCL